MPPDSTVFATAASGPTALATSLEPWAKAIAQAVKIIRIPNTRSTLAKRCCSLGTYFTRLTRKPPNAATSRPIRNDRGTALANLEPSPRSISTPICFRPLSRVTMEIMKPTIHI